MQCHTCSEDSCFCTGFPHYLIPHFVLTDNLGPTNRTMRREVQESLIRCHLKMGHTDLAIQALEPLVIMDSLKYWLTLTKHCWTHEKYASLKTHFICSSFKWCNICLFAPTSQFRYPTVWQRTTSPRPLCWSRESTDRQDCCWVSLLV